MKMKNLMIIGMFLLSSFPVKADINKITLPKGLDFIVLFNSKTEEGYRVSIKAQHNEAVFDGLYDCFLSNQFKVLRY